MGLPVAVRKSKKRTFEYTIKRRFGSEFMAGRRNFYLRLVRKSSSKL